MVSCPFLILTTLKNVKATRYSWRKALNEIDVKLDLYTLNLVSNQINISKLDFNKQQEDFYTELGIMF